MKGLIKIVSIIGLIAVAGIMAGCSKAEMSFMSIQLSMKKKQRL